MLTDEQIKALLAGCEGVTKGPWAQDQFELQEVREGLGKRNAVAFCRQSSNAAHIARCDPQTIAELCKELLAWRESFPGYAGKELERTTNAD